MSDAIKALAVIMGGQAVQKTQTARAVYDFIMVQPESEQPELVEFLFTNFGQVEENDQELVIELMSDDTWAELIRNHSKVEQTINELIVPELPTKEIASQLWMYMKHFLSTDERIFALVSMLYDDRMPLLGDEERVGAINMSSAEYMALVSKAESRKLFNEIEEIKAGSFKQWTAMAGAFLYRLEQAKDLDERLIIMIGSFAPIAPHGNERQDFPGGVALSREEVDKYEEIGAAKIRVLQKILDSSLLSSKPARAGALLHLIESELVKEVQNVLLSHILVQSANSAPRGGLDEFLARLFGGGHHPSDEDCAICEHLECPGHPLHGDAVEL